MVRWPSGIHEGSAAEPTDGVVTLQSVPGWAFADQRPGNRWDPGSGHRMKADVWETSTGKWSGIAVVEPLGRPGLGIEIRTGKTVDGAPGIERVQWAGNEVVVGYEITPARRGIGLAGRVVTLIIDYLVEDRSVERLGLMIDKENAASIRVAEKLGFEREDRGTWWWFSRSVR